jgi:hypothetical protein
LVKEEPVNLEFPVISSTHLLLPVLVAGGKLALPAGEVTLVTEAVRAEETLVMVVVAALAVTVVAADKACPIPTAAALPVLAVLVLAVAAGVMVGLRPVAAVGASAF